MLKFCYFTFCCALFAVQPAWAQAARNLPARPNDTAPFAGVHADAATRAPVAVAVAPASNGIELNADGILVGAVSVEGAPEIPPTAFMPVIAPFVGHKLRAQDLQDLLSVVSGVARNQGYVLSHSTIPAQTMSAGVLKVAVDLGRIDRIDLVGDNSKAVRAILSPLVGRPARQATLERQLLLAADVPGIVIGQVSYLRDGDTRVLQVEVRHKPVSLQATLDNRGDPTIGPLRMTLAYDLNGILGEERLSFSGQFQVAPAHPDELVSTAARIAYVFNNAGTELVLSGAASHTHPGGRLAAYNFSGQLRDVQLALDHPLLRGRSASLWLRASIEYQTLDQFLGSAVLWRDHAALLGLSINGYAPLAAGRLRAGLSGAWMLGLPGVTLATDPLASRPGAGAGAKILDGWANWEGPLAGAFSARLAFSGQLATAPLPIGQQLGIGGADFGRAYDYAERTGDEGALGSVELQYKLPTTLTGKQGPVVIYGFADAGYVTNLDNALGTGTLVSAGVGSRLSVMQKLRLGLELAFPVNQPRADSNSMAPRVSVNLGTSF